ncbi:MAG: putative hemagglutinin/hemolysin [Geobacteraceae bacterium]|nr:MAG: putative hemagglutinin/hemolysin [Geobacteraceae bacterium]
MSDLMDKKYILSMMFFVVIFLLAANETYAEAPTATSASITTQEDTAKGIILEASDVDGDPLTYSVVTTPVHGVLTGTAPSLTYTPEADYNGPDSFTFTAYDGTADSNTATVSITVAAVNDPPVAAGQSVITNRNTATAVTLAASDVDGDTLTYSVVSQPSHGGLSGTAPNLTYTPSTRYSGSDNFTFKANDGTVYSNVATVSITVNFTNVAPEANAQSVTTAEDTAKGITLSATDGDGDPLTYSVVTQPAHGTLTGAAPNLTYTPAANYDGSDSFTFKANDGTVDSSTATVSVTITAVNDAPVANAQSVTTAEDTTKAITLTGSDIDGNPLTYSVVAQPAHGTLTGTAPNLTYQPAANYNGPDSFTFKANDGTADSAAATVSLTVTAANDAPVAQNGTITTNEDTAATGTLAATDIENTPLTYSIVSQGSKGTVTITNAATGAYSYIPSANANGYDSFTFKASDGSVDSNIATVTVTITAVNDAPVAQNGILSTNEDTAATGTLAATDIDSASLTYSIVNQGSKGNVTITNAATGAYSYTPNANANGPDSFTFKARDGSLDSSTATVTITITTVNDAPVANGQSVTTAEDTAKAITLTGSDTDGDPLTYSVVTQPAHGALTGTAPNLTYQPLLNYNGPDSFTFKANDGTADSAAAAVSLTVTPVNDAPVAANGTLSTSEDTAVTGTLAATDIDIASLTYSIVSQGAKGTVTITNTATGAYRYTPNANANGSDSFTFRARDGSLYSNTATVTVSITPVNDVPTAPTTNAPPNGTFNINEVTTLTPALVVNNSTDLDLDTLSYTFEIDMVDTFDSSNKQTSPTLTGGYGTTSWTPAALSDNTTWYWRAKANDGSTDGPWMTTGSFFVNQFNDAPDPPALVNPPNNGDVISLAPTLTVQATDIDHDSLTYDFEVYLDSGLTNRFARGTMQGTSWRVTPPLLDNTRYFWIAYAVDVKINPEDDHGAYSRPMAVSSFLVDSNGINDPPTITIDAPGATINSTSSPSYTIRWTDTDPDSDATITLYFDHANSGNNGTPIVTGISEDDPANSYTWNTSARPDGTYYIYAKIEDEATSVYSLYAGPVIIDRTKPAAPSITGITPTNNTQPTWSWSSGSGGNGPYRYKLDNDDLTTGAVETPATTFTPATALNQGIHTLYVQERDAAGNWSTTGSFAIDVDTVAPRITGAASTTASGFYKAGSIINVTVNFSEPVSSTGLTIVFNSGASFTTGVLPNVNSYSGTYIVGAGENTSDLGITGITGTITDAAANGTVTSQIPAGNNIDDTKAIVIDTTAPVVSAGANQTRNTFFTQTAIASDINFMTYAWSKQAGPGEIVFGTPTVLSTAISASVDGTYTLRFTATDAAGNSASSDMTLVWDTTAPRVIAATSTTANGHYKAGSAVNVTVNFSEPVSSAGLTITLNAGASVTTGALTNTASFSGIYTVAAGENSADLNVTGITGTITDAATNGTTNPAVPAGQNLADAKDIVVDTTAPDTAINGQPANPSDSKTGSFTFSSPDNTVTFECSINAGAYAACISPYNFNLSALSDGNHTFSVRAKDLAANIDPTPASYTWMIDTVMPAAAINGAPPSPTNATTATLTIGGDEVVAYRYKLDAGAYSAETPITTGISLASLGEGEHTVSVVGRDSAGNWQAEANATTKTWMVDTQGPVFVEPISVIPNGSYTKETPQNIRGEVKETNGVPKLTITVDGTSASKLYDVMVTADPDQTKENIYDFSQAIELFPGVNTITIIAADLAGNETLDTRTVTYDTNGPTIILETPKDNSASATSFVEVTGTVDETADIGIYIENSSGKKLAASLAGVTAKFQATVYYAPGTNTIEITATDLTGNPNTIKRTVTFDDLKPSLAITDPPQDLRTDLRSMVIKGTVSDALSAVTVTMTKDAETFTPSVADGAFAQEVIFTEDKVYHVIVKAKDEAGNEASVQRNIIFAKPAKGDINNDLRVNMLDALIALRISVGLLPQTDNDLINGDVAPLVDGKSVSDGRIDVGDAVIILKAIVGLVRLE